MAQVNCFLRLVIAALSLMVVIPCTAQHKYEREYRMKAGAVAKKAAQFIEAVFTGTKIHWYTEESIQGTTIEAKFRAAGKHYSIEFDSTGTVQDVEILSYFNSIPAKTRAALTEQLSRKFTKFNVLKTQIQWTASPSTLTKALLTNELSASVQIRYELILKGRQNGQTNYYEVLCEPTGALVHLQEIVQGNTNNLLY